MARVDDLARSYTTAILRALKYRATWLPNEVVELGSVGYLEDGVFHERQHLRDFGINFAAKVEATRASFVYQSSSGVAVTFKARGEASEVFQGIGRASAGALIEFWRQGAAVLSAPSCRVGRILDFRSLERQLKYVEDWNSRYVIVTKVVTADSATILVSSSDHARVELRATANADIGSAELAELSAGFRAVVAHDVGIQIVAQGGLTPLYEAHPFTRGLIDVVRGRGRTIRGLQARAGRRTATKRTS